MDIPDFGSIFPIYPSFCDANYFFTPFEMNEWRGR